jgi:hypothetical protein
LGHQLSVHVNSVYVDAPHNPPIAVHGHFHYTGLLVKGQVRKRLFCPGAEGLFSLWGVYIGQADFDLLVVYENRGGVAVGNLDDFALIVGGNWGLRGNQIDIGTILYLPTSTTSGRQGS